TVSRCGTPVIFSTTSLSDSRCWMLTVEITSMPASSISSTSCQRFALREPGPAGEHGVEVHLLEERAAVRQVGPRYDLQPVKEHRRVRPRVGLHERHDHVGPALETPGTFAEHGEGLADPGGGAEIDPELSPLLLAHGLLVRENSCSVAVCQAAWPERTSGSWGPGSGGAPGDDRCPYREETRG